MNDLHEFSQLVTCLNEVGKRVSVLLDPGAVSGDCELNNPLVVMHTGPRLN